MKKIAVLLAVVMGFTIASCKKDKGPKADTTLFGTWELAWISGGLSKPAAVTNSGNKYDFKSDSTYVKYLENKVTASGRFHIKIDETRDTVQFGTITFTDPTYSEAWQRTPHTITIGTSLADGPSYTYHKVK